MDNRYIKGMAWALTLSLFFVSTLCLFFEPTWETNDDVAMSMIAHGYGIAASSSPKLVFSNIIWGYIVRLTPNINGILGYSIATYGILIICGAVIFLALRKVGLSCVIAFSICTLLLVRPILFPQFTINAGLLTVCAVVCWYIYGAQGTKSTLIVGSILAFFGCLIRSHEFLLVLLVAAPLLPWTKLAKDWFTKVIALGLVSSISGAFYLDHRAYENDEWQKFNALNSVRVQYTDL